ncbi:putative membrane protein (TIGR02226 family) [Mucilaginibacter gracilis]|uniref:Putative membrane protein (TIGR02226 family) n=1 Tax=Mucilaginibacter gracilis TaxID=423350 RepID=A0A495J627_9SPHI|nr:BatA domain-containing protein [Mucilaginibacter gracilis]RKR84435.1 putative membrane protein (TIGR02226 family) [Mucilaginibacter gracilis]
MLFVYPAFLFGLLSLAIPVIIHLFHFRQYKKVYFSNVQFLKNIQQQQSSRKNLKKLLILITRLLAVFFLVLAFARPFIPAKQNITVGKTHLVSIFVDNSYSMQTVNREGSLLDEARRRAKEIASGYGINDRFQLLTQDFEGRHQRLLNRDEFNDEVDKIKISPQSRQLQQVVNRAQSLLNTQFNGQKALYVISDFQKNMFSPKAITTDTAVQLGLVELKPNLLPNIAVDSVWLLSAVHRPGESEKLVVRLHNYADQKAEKVPLKLLINGQQKALGGFTLNARGVQNDTLSFSGLQAGWQQGEIDLQDNPVNFDNQFYFTFKVQQQMPLLLVDGGAPNPYIQAVFNADAFFKPQLVHNGNIDYAGLAAYPLVVLSDLKTISTGLAQQLKTYVSNGGTLLVFPADGADVASYKLLLQPLAANYPGKVLTNGGRVSYINLQNALFKNTFEQLPQNPDLPVVQRYYDLEGSSRNSGENLMELPGGKAFFGVYPYAKGRTYVSAVPLDDSYSNLAHHALLVPLLFRIALLSGHYPALFYTIGNDEAVETLPIQATDKQVLKLHKAQQVIIPDVRQQEGTVLYLSDQVHEAGNYTLQKQDSLIAVLAFNSSRSESDLTYLSSAELKAKISGKQGTVIQAGAASLKDTVAKTNIGLELWKLCIILALISLAAEIVLLRFYQPEKQVVPVNNNPT